MSSDDLRRRLLDRADRERARQTAQALTEIMPGTSQGRALPAAPLDQRPGAGGPSVTVQRNPGSGEMIALTGTATIAGSGSGVVGQLDTIQQQAGLPAVDAAGDTVTLRKGLWLAEVDIRWTDGHRGTSVPEITLGGTPIPQTWPDDGGVWSRWVDQMVFPVDAQAAFDVHVTPDDGASHDAKVTVRASKVEKIRAIVDLRPISIAGAEETVLLRYAEARMGGTEQTVLTATRQTRMAAAEMTVLIQN